MRVVKPHRMEVVSHPHPESKQVKAFPIFIHLGYRLGCKGCQK